MRALSIAAALLIGVTSTLVAQDRSLPDRLSPVTKNALERVIDSARAVGLPSGPLYDKVSEGVLKGADDERILRAVRTLAHELSDARAVLGPNVQLPLLSAGASALHAGVSSAELLRIVKPSSGGAPDAGTLTTALVTLVDLVAKRVPVALATSSIQSLVDRKANDRQFAELRSGVEQDVLAGRTPDASVTARVKLQTGTTPP